jgi:DNA-directed RNA polymerase subunit RPC12/RpoP
VHKIVIDINYARACSCGFTHRTKGGLMKHVANTRPDGRHPCAYCDASFTTTQTALTHEVVTHGIEETYVFVCETCGRTFQYNCALNEHVVLDHPATTLLKCTHCPSVYSSMGAFEVHWHRKHHARGLVPALLMLVAENTNVSNAPC